MLWHFLVARVLPGPPSPTNRRESRMWTDLRIDVADVVRTLGRHPRFVAGVSLALGIGVGSVAAVFSMANQLLLRPLPGTGNSEGAAFLEFNLPERRQVGVSGPDLEALRREATLLEGFTTYDNVRLQASVGGARPVAVEGYTVYGDYFEVLGVRPLLGRLLSAEESGPDADPLVAVISQNLWERLFDKSPDVVGRRFDVRGHAFTVVGVVAGGFRGTDLSWPIDAWLPRSAFAPLESYPQERLGSRESRLNQWFLVRVRPGVALAAAQAELDALVANLVGSGEGGDYLSGVRTALHGGFVPALITERVQRTLVVLGAASGLLLVITCANVANVMLVRGVQRRSDAAVRRALGASAGRLARRRLLEAFLLAMTGTITGLGVAALVSHLFRGVRVLGLPGFEAFSVDVRVVLFATCAAIVTALLSGTLPAILAARFDVTRALRDGGDRSTSRHGFVRGGISALQIGLSLTLLVGCVLLVRTVRNVYSVDAGMTLDGVTALTFDMERDRPELAELDARHRELLAAVRSVASVEAAALHGWYGPYDGMLSTRIARIEQPDLTIETGIQWVTPGWFELFEVDASSGRTLREPDWSAASPMPVVITAALAERLFGQQQAVGRTAMLGQRTQINEVEIVGVVSNVRSVDLRLPPDEAVFVPHTTQPALLATLTILFRASDAATVPAVRRAVEMVVPHLPVPEPAPLTDRVNAQLAEQLVFARLLTLLAGIAIVLSVFGLYGVIAFAVAGRRREFGIRIAVGADGAHIGKLVLQTAVWIVLFGTAFGLAGAYYLARLLESRLFGIAAVDAASYAGAAGLLALVATLACWIPTRSAMKTDPVATLKAE
jgi:putative ABC transport system permease protein